METMDVTCGHIRLRWLRPFTDGLADSLPVRETGFFGYAVVLRSVPG